MYNFSKIQEMNNAAPQEPVQQAPVGNAAATMPARGCGCANKHLQGCERRHKVVSALHMVITALVVLLLFKLVFKSI